VDGARTGVRRKEEEETTETPHFPYFLHNQLKISTRIIKVRLYYLFSLWYSSF
jgi:hypothetical protein